MITPRNTRKTWPIVCLWLCFVTIIFPVSFACTGGDVSQPPGSSDNQSLAAVTSSDNVSQNTAPPAMPTPPPSVPPAQPSQTPPVPQPSAAGLADSTALVTVPASQLVLNIDDLGQGWVRGSTAAAPVSQAVSYSQVYYSQGSAFPPVIQNAVAVYRSVENASNAYEKEKAAGASLSYPNIGNECFLNDSVPRDKKLVFRKNNVVVWIWIQQYASGDIESYARIEEKRITNSLLPSIPVPASTPSSQTPSQPAPAVQPPTTSPVDTMTLIKKQAYQMVLTLDDMGPGWNRGNASPPAKQRASSTCHVYYSQGAAFSPGVQNSTAVYRSIEIASDAYEKEKPAGVALSYPQIGDDCFLNDSLPLDKKLVFRKNNVIVWIWVQQYAEGDIEGYARTVEQKIVP